MSQYCEERNSIVLGWKLEDSKMHLLAKEYKLNSNETVLDISENQENIFRPRISMSYYAAVTANYQMSDSYFLYFSPYARVMSESITQPNYALDQDYDLWGINLGIRYFFGKGDF